MPQPIEWDPDRLRARLLKDPVTRMRLETLADATGERASEVFLVGGTLRDAVLNRPVLDFDLTLSPAAFRCVEPWAKTSGGRSVRLHEDVPTLRVVFPDATYYDLTAWRRPTLEADLCARDFTVNALAVPLMAVLGRTPWRWMDPCRGREDLEAGFLRWTAPESPREDPLRILRAFRFVAQYGFHLTEQVRRSARLEASRLRQIAPERVRQEWFRLLEAQRCYRALRAADRDGVVAVLFPELAALRGVSQNRFHHLDVWDHTLDALDRFERNPVPPTLRAYQEKIEEYLSRTTTHEISHRALVKFALLLHDVGKPQTRSVGPNGTVQFRGHARIGAELAAQVAARIKLGARATEGLVVLVREHLRTMQLDEGASPRALNRFLRATGEHWLGELLLIWADLSASRGPARTPEQVERTARTLRKIADHYFQRVLPVQQQPRLITGRDLIDRFGIPEGPRIGAILRAVEEARIEGRITTREEALQWVADYLSRASDVPVRGTPTAADRESPARGSSKDK